MICFCCDSMRVSKCYINPEEYYRCNNCGLIYLKDSKKEESLDSLRKHYQKNDPHKEVSKSKKVFYDYVIGYLSSRSKRNGTKILDIGCGYGYFINIALQKGWKPFGIEIVEDAANASRKKIGYENVFQGELKGAGLKEESFDAITLWDVLAIIDNPFDELKECHRLLKKGGIIGIRTRNVWFQIAVYRLFDFIKKIALRFGLKSPYVFNKYCFSGRSLYALLSRLGFINIKIANSPLTFGDPYNHIPFHYLVKLAKTCINILSKLIFWITHGRCLVGPSLLIWAEKP